MQGKRQLRAKGKTKAGTHIPVLLNETLNCLNPEPGQIVVDCTLGFGGHAKHFIKRIGPGGTFIGLDVDGKEFEKTQRRLCNDQVELHFVRSNFSNIKNVLDELGIEGCDIILADIGVSSMQVDDATRGISYKADGPLDMRMDRRLEKTGADLLNELSQEELSNALLNLSDEPDHEIISQMIVGQRISRPIETVAELIRLVFNAKGMTERTWKKDQKALGFGSLHPAARTFQTIRILVNDEISALEKLLADAPSCLNPAGRIGIISFHSTEDRAVKNSFKSNYDSGIYQSISQKPITPRTGELIKNSRSASAKFRYAVKAE